MIASTRSFVGIRVWLLFHFRLNVDRLGCWSLWRTVILFTLMEFGVSSTIGRFVWTLDFGGRQRDAGVGVLLLGLLLCFSWRVDFPVMEIADC